MDNVAILGLYRQNTCNNGLSGIWKHGQCDCTWVCYKQQLGPGLLTGFTIMVASCCVFYVIQAQLVFHFVLIESNPGDLDWKLS